MAPPQVHVARAMRNTYIRELRRMRGEYWKESQLRDFEQDQLRRDREIEDRRKRNERRVRKAEKSKAYAYLEEKANKDRARQDEIRYATGEEKVAAKAQIVTARRQRIVHDMFKNSDTIITNDKVDEMITEDIFKIRADIEHPVENSLPNWSLPNQGWYPKLLMRQDYSPLHQLPFDGKFKDLAISERIPLPVFRRKEAQRRWNLITHQVERASKRLEEQAKQMGVSKSEWIEHVVNSSGEDDDGDKGGSSSSDDGTNGTGSFASDSFVAQTRSLFGRNTCDGSERKVWEKMEAVGLASTIEALMDETALDSPDVAEDDYDIVPQLKTTQLFDRISQEKLTGWMSSPFSTTYNEMQMMEELIQAFDTAIQETREQSQRGRERETEELTYYLPDETEGMDITQEQDKRTGKHKQEIENENKDFAQRASRTFVNAKPRQSNGMGGGHQTKDPNTRTRPAMGVGMAPRSRIGFGTQLQAGLVKRTSPSTPGIKQTDSGTIISQLKALFNAKQESKK